MGVSIESTKFLKFHDEVGGETVSPLSDSIPFASARLKGIRTDMFLVLATNLGA